MFVMCLGQGLTCVHMLWLFSVLSPSPIARLCFFSVLKAGMVFILVQLDLPKQNQPLCNLLKKIH